MSRTDIYRCFYALGFGCVMAIVLAIASKQGIDAGIGSLTLFLVAVFAGRRVQYFFWRDHFLGRQHYGMRRWTESLEASQRFLQEAKQKPWLRHLVWLNFMVTSRDIVAVTQNNVACVYMALADRAQAESYIDEALKRDSLYPVPHLNRAKILIWAKQDDAARAELAECRRLGYRDYSWEKLVQEVRGASDDLQIA